MTEPIPVLHNDADRAYAASLLASRLHMQAAARMREGDHHMALALLMTAEDAQSDSIWFLHRHLDDGTGDYT